MRPDERAEYEQALRLHWLVAGGALGVGVGTLGLLLVLLLG